MKKYRVTIHGENFRIPWEDKDEHAAVDQALERIRSDPTWETGLANEKTDPPKRQTLPPFFKGGSEGGFPQTAGSRSFLRRGPVRLAELRTSPPRTGAGRVRPVQSAVVAKMGKKRLSGHIIVDLVMN